MRFVLSSGATTPSLFALRSEGLPHWENEGRHCYVATCLYRATTATRKLSLRFVPCGTKENARKIQMTTSCMVSWKRLVYQSLVTVFAKTYQERVPKRANCGAAVHCILREKVVLLNICDMRHGILLLIVYASNPKIFRMCHLRHGWMEVKKSFTLMPLAFVV